MKRRKKFISRNIFEILKIQRNTQKNKESSIVIPIIVSFIAGVLLMVALALIVWKFALSKPNGEQSVPVQEPNAPRAPADRLINVMINNDNLPGVAPNNNNYDGGIEPTEKAPNNDNTYENEAEPENKTVAKNQDYEDENENYDG